MIKSKIDARERALELAVTFLQGCHGIRTSDIVDAACIFRNFLIGYAELPEVQSDTELVKAFLEVMNSEFEKKCKPNTPDYGKQFKWVKQVYQMGKAGISAEVRE